MNGVRICFALNYALFFAACASLRTRDVTYVVSRASYHCVSGVSPKVDADAYTGRLSDGSWWLAEKRSDCANLFRLDVVELPEGLNKMSVREKVCGTCTVRAPIEFGPGRTNFEPGGFERTELIVEDEDICPRGDTVSFKASFSEGPLSFEKARSRFCSK